MPRAIWKGTISFGLVSIPVSLYSAVERGSELHFRQLDRRTLSPVKEKRVSEQSGDEVPWEEITKGYEYDAAEFVVIDPDELRRAHPEATQTIDIVQSIGRGEIDPAYFDTPYYLEPHKSGRKGYALLRETLRRADRIAIARVVIRTSSTWPRSCRSAMRSCWTCCATRTSSATQASSSCPATTSRPSASPRRKVAMAEQLVATIEEPWRPEAYHATTLSRQRGPRDDPGEGGEGRDTTTVAAAQPAASDVIDIMAMLKRSIDARGTAAAGGSAADGVGPERARPRLTRAPQAGTASAASRTGAVARRRPRRCPTAATAPRSKSIGASATSHARGNPPAAGPTPARRKSPWPLTPPRSRARVSVGPSWSTSTRPGNCTTTSGSSSMAC